MARKKLNTKFVWITLSVVGALALAGGVVYKLMGRRQNPTKLVAIADALMARGEYEEAARHYAGAAALNKDPAMMVKAGDVLYSLAYNDPDNIGAAQKLWQSAIQTDPTYTPALQRQLDDYQALQLIGYNRSDVYEEMRKTAERICAIDPDNKRAKSVIPLSTVRAWLVGVETEPQKVREAVAALKDVEAANPTEPELPYFRAIFWPSSVSRRNERPRRVANRLWVVKESVLMPTTTTSGPNRVSY